MSLSLKISFLYLLLIIPQYGNSPLPVMDSWLQKDEDDSFVQRDMTSSLTGGDENFKTAHQTYQNSLIRKKKSEGPVPKEGPFGYKKFTSPVDQSQVYSQSSLFYGNRFSGNDYNAKLSGNARSNANFEDYDDDEAAVPSDRFRSKPTYVGSKNDEVVNLKQFNKLKGDSYVNIVPSKDLSSFDERNVYPGGRTGLNGYGEDAGKSAKWTLCKRMKDKYTNQPMNLMQSMPRETHDAIARRNLLESVDEEGRNWDPNDQYSEPEGFDEGNPQIFGGNEYYDAEINPMSSEDEVVMEGADYDPIMSDHGRPNKREGSVQSQQFLMPVMGGYKESSDATKALLDSLTATKINSDGYLDQRDDPNGNLKIPANFDSAWNFNSNLQSEALRDVVKNSQRALKEVQFYQQKLATASNENNGLKRDSLNSQQLINWDGKNVKFDDKRPKREDEDEQKNMKTGTDEGGGGEYEDEEGKGHKDEEEYYEDADLSDDESNTEIRTNENFRQKYVKREIAKDAALKNSKGSRSEGVSPDYEFNIENAPVENADNFRKIPLRREGEKAINSSARKGLKIWDQWGKWSPCSVTCGVGRSTRWRHCIGGGCAQGEKEAQIKRCTNPAC